MRKLTTLLVASLLVAVVVLFAVNRVGQAQANQAAQAGEDQRGRVAKMIEKGDTAGAEKMLMELQSKQNNHSMQPGNFHTFFEEIKACGFYPQETRLECVIDIKQLGGYAGGVGTAGSIENVLFCVDWNNDGAYNSSESVGEGSVAMHDESAGSKPNWQYAVYRDFDPRGGVRTSLNNPNLATTISNGPTRNARAILSWFVEPTDCNYQPYWGNVVNYRIRFDPIR